jgi:hypothetical protein
MRYWFDTEFIEDGKTIDLISIGIVAEDGREFYAQNTDCDYGRASEWVRENVIAKLAPRKHDLKTKAQIKDAVLEFVGTNKPELWAYYADYDWVVLCQLFGTMMDLPKGWPMLAYDFRQWLDLNGLSDIKQPDSPNSHSALDDARWLAHAFSEHGPK